MVNFSNKKELQKILEKYVKGMATEKERIFLEAYYEQFNESFDGLSAWSEIERNKLRNEMKQTIQERIEIDSRNKRTTRVFRIAASVLILIASGIGIWYWPSNEAAKHVLKGQASSINVSDTTFESEKHIYLSDGSYVLLSPGSILTYDDEFTGDTRQVKLEGEAYFDIQKDTIRPFIVNTNGLNTKVLGTAFTISSFKDLDSVTVTVTRGMVEVTSEAGKVEILEKDDQVVVNRGDSNMVLRKLKSKEVQSIEPEEFVMDNLKVEKAIEIISTRWNCQVRMENSALGQCRFTTSFTREDSLEDVVAVMCAVIGGDYKIENNVVFLTGSGCN